MTIYFLPVEPLENRPFYQWIRWFKRVFEGNGIDYEIILGEKVEEKVDNKNFLNFKNTFIWKFSQLKELFKRNLKDGDVILIADGEFPGIEAIEYFKKFAKNGVKIVEIWHAGTYDKWDLTYQNGLDKIGKNLEEVWFDIADLVFVSTNFHKDLICQNRIVDSNKIKVTGLPVDVNVLNEVYETDNKEHDIIFTGRLSKEKGYDIVKDLELSFEMEGYDVLIAQEWNFLKYQYYRELGKSKVVFAPSRQETFGYGVVEGMAMNVIPVVPNKLSFTDYVPKEWRYNNIDEMYRLLRKGINESGKVNMKKYVEKYQYQRVIKNMLDEIDKIL